MRCCGHRHSNVRELSATSNGVSFRSPFAWQRTPKRNLKPRFIKPCPERRNRGEGSQKIIAQTARAVIRIRDS